MSNTSSLTDTSTAQKPSLSDTQHPIAPLWRRLIAMVYDILLVAAVVVLYGFIIILLKHLLGIPMPEGERAASGPIFFTGMVVTVYLFFCGFWVVKGQTLGMRTWRLRVEGPSGQNLNWKTALIRISSASLSLAAFGLGYLWSIVDKNNHCLHDHISQTRIVVIPKQKT